MIQSTPFDVKPAELIGAAKELQFEGVIAKRKGSLYEPGRRSGAWVKYKLHRSQEFVIGGYTAGNPFDALIVGCYDDGKLKYIGKVRAGFVPHLRCAMMPLFKELTTDEYPFADLPEKRRVQINFQEWTPDGHLRHASFAGLRSDKDPAQIVQE